jgi:hypothetical protein
MSDLIDSSQRSFVTNAYRWHTQHGDAQIAIHDAREALRLALERLEAIPVADRSRICVDARVRAKVSAWKREAREARNPGATRRGI